MCTRLLTAKRTSTLITGKDSLNRLAIQRTSTIIRATGSLLNGPSLRLSTTIPHRATGGRRLIRLMSIGSSRLQARGKTMGSTGMRLPSPRKATSSSRISLGICLRTHLSLRRLMNSRHRVIRLLRHGSRSMLIDLL